MKNGIISRPVHVPPNQVRGNRSSDSPFFTAKPCQHKNGRRVKGCEPNPVIRDEIECCYNEQRRRHLGDDQRPWLTRKFLCETHLNKSAWIDSLEQAELAANKQKRIATSVYRKDVYSRNNQNGVKAF